MIIAIANCPKKLYSVDKFTVVKPFTHVAETAVNNASNGVTFPLLQIGSISTIQPTSITDKKPKQGITYIFLSFNIFCLLPFLYFP